MDRPSTSKARGVCQYYTSPRGCFAGDSCKFLHGAQEKLTPYDKMPGVAPASDADEDMCSICYEKPVTYGLLAGCSHIFCLNCIREWRDPQGKSDDIVGSGMTKSCPLCRRPSRFITPSSRFFGDGDPQKMDAIQQYKASMARMDCRYFLRSSPTRRFCPFGKDCFYGHTNADGSKYVFPHGVEHYMPIFKNRMHTADFTDYGPLPISALNRILDYPLDDLNATISAIRASLPALVERGLDDFGDIDTEYIGAGGLSRLADRMIASLTALQEEQSVILAEHRPPRSTAAAVNDGDDEMPPLLPVSSPDSTPTSTAASLPAMEDLTVVTDEAPPAVRYEDRLSFTLRPISPVFVPTPPASPPPVTFPTGPPPRFSTAMSSRSDLVNDVSDESSLDHGSEYYQSETVPAELYWHTLQGTETRRPASAPPQSEHWSPAGRSIAAESAPQGELVVDESVSEAPEFDFGAPVRDLDQDPDPPFMTDGRGRVVYSRSGDGSGTRGDDAASAVAGPSRTVPSVSGPTPAATGVAARCGRRQLARRIDVANRPPASEPIPVNGPARTRRVDDGYFVTDGRGNAIWTSEDVVSDPHDDIDEENETDVEGEDHELTATLPRTPPGGSRRSIMGTVFGFFFGAQ